MKLPENPKCIKSGFSCLKKEDTSFHQFRNTNLRTGNRNERSGFSKILLPSVKVRKFTFLGIINYAVPFLRQQISTIGEISTLLCTLYCFVSIVARLKASIV